ncbi:Phosphatidylinositol 4-kinase lsb6, partial [Neolecta irregularis DAH-3]
TVFNRLSILNGGVLPALPLFISAWHIQVYALTTVYEYFSLLKCPCSVYLLPSLLLAMSATTPSPTPAMAPTNPQFAYERLVQADDIDTAFDRLDSDNNTGQQQVPSKRSSRLPSRARSNSGIDIKAINARLEHWADEIASKFRLGKSKGKSQAQALLLILTLDHGPPMTPEEFEKIADSVRYAISRGVHPQMIRQGSSGSYFVRDINGTTIGIFKPKNEEPYGKMNPKWTKWLHRTLFPCFFGRSCLIPNLSYISEAAACVIDRQLQTFMVPYTDIVWLSSKSFHYDWFDRRAYYVKGKPLSQKLGSFQVFLQGFRDANLFLRDHPWPDQNTSNVTAAVHKKKSWVSTCRAGDDDSDDDDTGYSRKPSESVPRFTWTDTLQQNFREELEKLVILDYIMRNTDRGLDNWMIKICTQTQDVKIVTPNPPSSATGFYNGFPAEPHVYSLSTISLNSPVYGQGPSMAATEGPSSSVNTPQQDQTHIHIGAIDNSLAFPWKHPDEWRSYPYGWLFLPVSLIGQPFSQKTRSHFLPLLTSSTWWRQTTDLLHSLFSQDSDFQERMFQKQLAVLKGQAWNVVETLKQPDQGPLELTRRVRVQVWDDEMEVPITVPLTAPASRKLPIHDEMDIATAASAPLVRELHHLGESAQGAQSPGSDLGSHRGDPMSLSDQWDDRRCVKTHHDRKSLDDRKFDPAVHTRRYSLGTSGRKYSSTEEDGDLGFSATEGVESSYKKVIVERYVIFWGQS